MKTKLGPKLQNVLDMIPDEYDLIWDTCCDHGNLGLACLELKKAPKVIFVDQVTSIIKNLRERLRGIPELSSEVYELQVLPAQKLKLAGGKELVCICGVGGEVTIDIIKKLDGDFDLLLSPQYHLFEVRRFLKDLGFKLREERLVFEGKFGRELLYVSRDAEQEINPIGKDLFNMSLDNHRHYLEGLVKHLEKTNSEALGLYREIITP